MNTRAYKLRLRREMRMRRKQLGVAGVRAERKLDQHVFNKLGKLAEVRRFMAGWLALVVLLIGFTLAQTWSLSSHYQSLQPVAGGTYTEGMLGSFTTANPIYATSLAERTVARLVFGSLFSYNDNNQLVGDLADKLTIDAKGQVYTVSLKQGVAWHDGEPFTANDVVFTYKTIQDADAASPYFSSWQDIAVTSNNPYEVTFTLKSPLAAFKYSLTGGILPEHLLGDVDPSALRTNTFNTVSPVGTGPFIWQDLSVSGDTADTKREQINLVANQQYHKGAPALSGFVVKTFRSQADLESSYDARELTAIAGASFVDRTLNDSEAQIIFPMTAEMMTFFKTSEGILADKSIRTALVRSVNVAEIISALHPPVTAMNSPLLPGQVGYDATIVQQTADIAAANKLLDEAGWTRSGNSVRQKDGQSLRFELHAEDTTANALVTSALQSAWRAIGVQVDVVLQNTNDFQTTLSEHTYDALLHGISIGSDPDVYAYWHGTQADARLTTRFNFSEYSSTTADEALQSGRSRLDDALRAAKYKTFLQAWRDDAPALALYQPQFIYLTRETVYGLNGHMINTAVDRFSNVEEWMIRRVKTTVD